MKLTKIPKDLISNKNDSGISYNHTIYSKYYDKNDLPDNEQLIFNS